MADAGEEEYNWWDEMDTETFIEQWNLDERAAAALRASSEEAVRSIISQGPILGDNPSAIVISRLRQVGGDSEQDWDTFVSMIDAKAKDTFSAQSEEVIQAVMAEGPLVGSNPSAILIGRIRKAKDAMGTGGRTAKTSG